MISVRTYKILRKLWVSSKVAMGIGSVIAMIWAIQFIITRSQSRHGMGNEPNPPPLFPGLPGQEADEGASTVRSTGDRQRSAEAAAVLAQLSSGPSHPDTSPKPDETTPPAAAHASVTRQATMPSGPRPPAVNASAVIPPDSKKSAAAVRPLAPRVKETTFDQEIEQAVSIQPLESSAPEVVQVRAILDRYRKSSGWWERMSLVRSPGRITAQAHQFYEVLHQNDPALDKLVGATRFDIGDESFIQLAFLSPDRWSNTVRVNFILSSRGDPQIDWESLVAYGENNWPDFVVKKVERPTLLRGYASLDDYYNYEFADREKFISVRLRSPDGKHTITGFAERESRDGQLLAKITGQLNSMLLDGPLPVSSGGPTVPATLRVAFPPHPQSDQCVRIHAVIADRWVLTDAEEELLTSK